MFSSSIFKVNIRKDSLGQKKPPWAVTPKGVLIFCLFSNPLRRQPPGHDHHDKHHHMHHGQWLCCNANHAVAEWIHVDLYKSVTKSGYKHYNSRFIGSTPFAGKSAGCMWLFFDSTTFDAFLHLYLRCQGVPREHINNEYTM
jgi:hypothetical protein